MKLQRLKTDFINLCYVILDKNRVMNRLVSVSEKEQKAKQNKN